MMSVFTQEQATDMMLKEKYQDGIQQGMQQKTISVVRNMKNKGMDSQLISEITGLPKEEIEKM